MAASFGDALMAGSAVKYPGFEAYDNLLKYIKPSKVYKPNMGNHKVYQKYQEVYNDLYESTKDLMHKVDSIANK